MAENPLLIEKRDKVAILTLNRPERLNALNRDLQDAINSTCRDLSLDDAVWSVIITGAGRGFSAGADLRGARPAAAGDTQPPRHDRIDTVGWVGRLAMSIYRVLDKPVIAAVNGVAAGAGMSLALACDMRVGTPETRFKTVFIERSLSPDSGMSFFLPRIVGYSRACDLIFTSRNVDAEEALRIGLLDRLVPAGKLIDEALAIANQIASWPPVAMQVARRVLQQSGESTLETQLRNETYGLALARRAPQDAQESMKSFLERRPAKFTGQ